MFFCLFTGIGNLFKKSYQRCRSSAVIFRRSSCALAISFLLYEYTRPPTPKTKPRRLSQNSLRGAFLKNTRFHPNISLTGLRQMGAVPLFSCIRKGGIHPSHHEGTHSCSACGAIPILCRYLSADIFLSVSGCPLGSYFLRRLYSERGFMTSRQSRSPRSRAMISTSAVAMLVATGMLYRSHIRSSSCSVSS